MEKSFERYARYPVSIFSFAEGTRFNEEKRLTQGSKFKNLLNPKSGGIGLTLTTMPYIQLMLDFSIYYHSSKRSFWDFLCGRMSKVTIKVREISIPENLLQKNYEEDMIFREDLKSWMENLWIEKDNFIEDLKK
jgi:1-acyl-sn-glycerol-3-phosphate acyltransferase